MMTISFGGKGGYLPLKVHNGVEPQVLCQGNAPSTSGDHRRLHPHGLSTGSEKCNVFYRCSTVACHMYYLQRRVKIRFLCQMIDPWSTVLALFGNACRPSSPNQ